MDLQTIIATSAVFLVVVVMFFVFKKTTSKEIPVGIDSNLEDLKKLKQEVDELKEMVGDLVSKKGEDA